MEMAVGEACQAEGWHGYRGGGGRAIGAETARGAGTKGTESVLGELSRVLRGSAIRTFRGSCVCPSPWYPAS